VKVVDGHLHSSPKGLGGYAIATKFKDVGGVFMVLVSLPPNHYGLPGGLEGLIKSFDLHVRECKAASEAGVLVVCLAGIHPSYVDSLVKDLGLHRIDEILHIIENALKHLITLRREGLIQGFGEFGRPHYKTLPESLVLNELIMSKVFEIAKDTDSIVHLHLEQAGIATVKTVDAYLRSANLPKKRVIFHHASINVARYAEELGYYSTILGREELIAKALSLNLKNVLIESDYIDDPGRPGVVMYPWELVKEVEEVARKKAISTQDLLNRFLENVKYVYDVDL